ncbi:hypothetical protein AB0E01_41410 [Nocardia vinacea]|uniref:hypothetical protein n=1 Tax=Nocardia vinacea TaxID=96468 RepID=UPI0033E5700F
MTTLSMLAALGITQLPAVLGMAVATLHPSAARRADARMALCALAQVWRWRR